MMRKAYGAMKFFHDELPYRALGGHAFRPLKVTFEVTYRCNLKCEMCYLVREGRNKKRKELTLDEIKNVISQLTKKIPVTFTGGEPFIKEGIMEVLEYASKRNTCGILTNGIMLNDERAKEVVKMGVSAITVSIDGPKEIHDKIRGPKAFDGAMEGIRRVQYYKKKLGKRKPNIHLNAVILPSNIDRLHEVVDIAAKLSVNICAFQILDPSLNRSGLNLQNKISDYMKPTIGLVDRIEPEKMKSFLGKIRKKSKDLKLNVKIVPPLKRDDLIGYYSGEISLGKYTCKMPWSSMRISPFGDVYPCFNYKIGNVRENSVSELWNNFYYKNFRKTLKGHGVFPACVGCCYMVYR